MTHELTKERSDQNNHPKEADAKINAQDKVTMRSKIDCITKTIQSLASQEDIKEMTAEMVKLINEAEFTKDSIDALETRVENLKTHQEKKTVIINVSSDLTHSNQLLSELTPTVRTGSAAE